MHLQVRSTGGQRDAAAGHLAAPTEGGHERPFSGSTALAEDVLAQLKSAGYGDLVVLPRVMFDHPDTISLDDMSPQEVANQLQRPLALADSMGDVWDALIGQSQVMYRPM